MMAPRNDEIGRAPETLSTGGLAVACLALAFAPACGTEGAGQPAGASAAAVASVSAAPTTAATVTPPASLVRKATPTERREADERACEANDVAACRKAANRHRGYGHAAGCGVSRSRPKPRRSVAAADALDDARQFDRWIRRACDLGDDDACVQGKRNVATRAISEHDVDVCARSAAADCALLAWQAGLHPEKAKSIAQKRAVYMSSGVTNGIFGDLYRREKKADALSKDTEEIAERVCKTTLECDDVAMMLDKNGFGAEALAPFRKSAGETLVSACLSGDCVCGEAIAYLEPADARRADLARIGCDDGEPDACYWLGRLTEESDPKNAVALYHVACPSLIASDEREEIYSRAACDRLSGMYEEGRTFEKDSDRAFFYSTLACTRAGFERDHAFCVRRAKFHARDYRGEDYGNITLTTGQVAKQFLYGIDGPPVDGKECERPSVQATCKREERSILTPQ